MALYLALFALRASSLRFFSAAAAALALAAAALFFSASFLAASLAAAAFLRSASCLAFIALRRVSVSMVRPAETEKPETAFALKACAGETRARGGEGGGTEVQEARVGRAGRARAATLKRAPGIDRSVRDPSSLRKAVANSTRETTVCRPGAASLLRYRRPESAARAIESRGTHRLLERRGRGELGGEGGGGEHSSRRAWRA